MATTRETANRTEEKLARQRTPPSIPAKPTTNRFVKRIAELLDATEKTQRQIAYELGYDKPNMISMFKQGTTRVPLEKVPALALALDADEADLVRLWLETYEPELKRTLDSALGVPLSENERTWIEGLRSVFPAGVPPFDDDARAITRVLAMHKGLAQPSPIRSAEPSEGGSSRR